MANNDTARLAVLIDADNASASVVKEFLEEVAKYGTATVKRAYGDWTTTNLVGWKEYLHRHAIQPMQQFAYTKGKNSTDSAFIIDAMDLLYAGNLDGFCLVSSDSDFTRLATRMREAGKVVYGFGERKTPEPFIAACDKFIFVEVLKRPAEAAAPVSVSDVPDLKGLLTHAIAETSRDSGWASLSAVGSSSTRTTRRSIRETTVSPSSASWCASRPTWKSRKRRTRRASITCRCGRSLPGRDAEHASRRKPDGLRTR